MRTYVQNMKTAITGYRDKFQASEQRIKEMGKVYGDEAMNREMEIQAQKMDQERRAAEYAIREAYSQGEASIKRWGMLDGSRITDDHKLIQADLLSPDQFRGMVEKYHDNYTMLSALRQYGERKNQEAAAEGHKRGNFLATAGYSTESVPTLESRQKALQRLQKSAMNMLDAIDHKGQYADSWERAFGDAFASEAIDHFGEGVDL